jgi:hypothetical protein
MTKTFDDIKNLCEGFRGGKSTAIEFRASLLKIIPELSDAATKEAAEAIFYWDIWLRES